MIRDFIEFRELSKSFLDDRGREIAVIEPLSMSIAEGEFVVFVGPSGCGKTTVMRMVGGLEVPTGGEVRIAGRPVEGPSRDKGMVFQSYSSFPWLTVLGNIRFGLKYRDDVSGPEKGRIARHYLELVGLAPFADYYVNRISGGMRQRVAIARTLAADAKVLLMDEPFGALDALTRERLQVQLLQLRTSERKTVIFVTHDVDEAVFLADRIVVFSARPARVLSDIRVCDAIPAERTLEVMELPAFRRLRQEVLGADPERGTAHRGGRDRRRHGLREHRMRAFDFAGKRVLVTGASHGIGRAVAEAFAGAGAELAILSSTPDVVEAGAAIAGDSGRPVSAEVCDITDRAAVRRIVGGLGRIDVLVNNAGLERVTPLAEPGDAVEATFARIIEINVIGTYYVTREALRLMRDGGNIVITSSIWGKSGAADFAAYVSSKHANIGFMRVLARELGPRGIRVNAVCPGWVRTRAALRSLGEVAAAARTSEEDALADILAAQALPGLMEPEDVTSLYLFLASDAARNITGQAVNVDRGEVMA